MFLEQNEAPLAVNAFKILARHYDTGAEAYRILVTHSVLVAHKAVAIAQAQDDPGLDLEFIAEAALLHDIGIGVCDAPTIGCQGTEPYIRHGVLGRAILEQEGFPLHALVCERHTGAGITASEIEEQGLPLPSRDLVPITPEEKIICIADKFYSKKPDRLWKEKPLEKICSNLSRYGETVARRWQSLVTEFLT